MSKFNLTSVKSNKCFCFFVVCHRLTYHHKSPSSLSQMGKREKGWRGGFSTLWVEAHTQWRFDHRRDSGSYSRGFKGDRWGRSHGSGGLWRFSPHNVQSLASNIVYTLQMPNTQYVQSLCCAKVNLKQEKCHTLPHQYLCISNKPTFYVIILNMFVFE